MLGGASPGEEHGLLGKMFAEFWRRRIRVEVSAHVVGPPLRRREQENTRESLLRHTGNFLLHDFKISLDESLRLKLRGTVCKTSAT